MSIMANTFPSRFVNNLLCFIVYVVNWGFLKLPIFMPEGMKDRYIPKTKAVRLLIVVHETIRFNIKNKVRFSQSTLVISQSRLNYIVIVIDTTFTCFAYVFMLELV